MKSHVPGYSNGGGTRKDDHGKILGNTNGIEATAQLNVTGHGDVDSATFWGHSIEETAAVQ